MKKKIKENVVNIGTGIDFTINYYAKIILNLIIPHKKILIRYDKKKPNGTPRKVLDISLAKRYGWSPKVKFDEAIIKTYSNFLKIKK